MKKLGDYINGNMHVRIYSDGTRIQDTIDPNDTVAKYAFPMNFDICITKYCNVFCEYCHEGATTSGKHGDILNLPFVDTLTAGTEAAIGGGNALAHPDLEKFLIKLRKKGVIPNITVNQAHLSTYKSLIKKLIDEELVFGVGISLVDSSNTESLQIINELNSKNIVIHVINGIFSERDVPFIIDKKMLILGYKDLRRGHSLLESNKESILTNMNWLRENLKYVTSKTILTSFDCLAIKQLSPKSSLNISDSEWDILFQGDDYSESDTATLYIDAVERKVARSSTHPIEDRIPFTNESISELFSMSKRCLTK